MALNITTLHSHSSSLSQREKLQRIFTVTPPIGGYSEWNLDTMGAINVSSYGTWSLTPNSAFSATIKAWGAGGSSTTASWGGGGGGFSSGSISVLSGSQYIMVVGQGGYNQFGVSGSRTVGGGAPGQKISSINGCGGGLSGLFTGSYTQPKSILIAGGGGGSIRATISSSAAGGGLNGQDGRSGDATGGTQLSGGAAGNFAISGSIGAQSGSALLGGYGSPQTGTVGNSGGGGGYFGGGGSCVNSGGGGSGYINPTVLNGATVSGSRWTQAKSTDTDNQGAGAGGFNSNGGDGRVIIR